MQLSNKKEQQINVGLAKKMISFISMSSKILEPKIGS
jgi:hypothetical protein